jgi:hypothetical protein
MTRHYAVSNHWLLLAALLVYFQAQKNSPGVVRRFVISALFSSGSCCHQPLSCVSGCASTDYGRRELVVVAPVVSC